MQILENYLCGGVVAYVDWINMSHHTYGYGIYTFRFFLAIINAVGFDVEVVPMVEKYVANINGNVGNVYTFYKWYANDFGLLYAMSWQFIVGIIHGYITKKMYSRKTEKWLLVFSISFYPLVMQFFMDEYITMLSAWVQIAFWIVIFLNTKVFYTHSQVPVYSDSESPCGSSPVGIYSAQKS
jgi:oligosaccharide repeat unit polymerase